MEWAIGIIIIIVALAGRYGDDGITGGLVLTAAGVALAVGIKTGSPWLASGGGIFLLAAVVGGAQAAIKHSNSLRD